ncbi:MAG TPA: carboxypeptidase regulatory-like domain-containing protein [Thermoanaerobaculia bacterium]
MKRCPNPRLLAVTAALCALLAVSAFAQFQTGNIYGKVQAKDGSALPGVTVTLSGVGAPQNTISDAQGNFRFISLSPGTYTLKAELAGYGVSTRAGISVNVGRNSDVTMTLNPSVAESITVTAEAPLLDVRKSGTSTNVTKIEMENIPSSRDPWTVLQSVPAVQVDRINVGGSQSGQQSNYFAKGAQGTDNTWNVDGVAITDMGATGSTPLYFDFDSFEEMQATTGGSDPRIQTPGVQLNMVTKRGTNDFKGSGRYFYTPGSLQAGAVVPASETYYLDQTNRINYVRDFGAEVGGPIWRDHAWFWLASADQKISNQASQAPGQIGAFDNIILRDKNAKLNAQILPSNSGVGFYTFGDKVRNARNLSPTRPFETSWKQTGPTKVYKVEDTQIIGSSLYLTGMWSKVTGGFGLFANGGEGPTAPSSYLDASGVYHNNFETFSTNRPQKQYRLDGSKFLDIGTMNHELKFGFGYRNTPVDSISSWPGPADGYMDFADVDPTECVKEGLPATCYRAALFRNHVTGYGEKYNDFYVGDTILMGNLTIQAGLRWDRQQSLNTAVTATANPILATPLTLPCGGGLLGNCGSSGTLTAALPAINFPGDQRSLKWNSVSPRIGATYSLGADKKTLLRAGYNRYVSQLGSAISSAGPLGGYTYFYFYGVDTNNDKVIQRNELQRVIDYTAVDPANPGALNGTRRVDYGMKVPTTDEIILGGERELMSDFSVGLTYTFRKYNNLLTNRYEKTQGAGDYYTSADYVPSTRTAGGIGGVFIQCNGTVSVDATGKQVCDGPIITTIPTNTRRIYTLAPGVDPPTYSVITNRPDYYQKFNGLELTATKRLSHKWMMRGSVSYNDYTEHCGANAFANPTPSIALPGAAYGGPPACAGGQVVVNSGNGSGSFGNVYISSKWNANVNGLYSLPWDINLGASLTARQGYAQPLQDRITGLPGGRTDVVLDPVGSIRFPNVYEFDVRIAKDFRFFNRTGLTLSGDLFNAPNQRTILQRNVILLSNGVSRSGGNRVAEIQSPRVWRLGAKFNF